VLAHISPAEAALLDKVTDGGSINPVTGLPEYFVGDMLGELGSGFSSLGDGLRKALPNLSEDFKTVGRRSTRQKAGGLVGDAVGQTVTDALGTLAKKSSSNPLGLRMSPSLGIGLENRSDKPVNPVRVQNEYVISENENTDRTNTQRAVPAPTWGVPPVTPKVKPKIAPATPPFQNPDRLRQWVKDAQAQTRLQPQQRTVSPGVQSVSAEASASNARTAEALSKTTDFSAIIPHLETALKTGGAQGNAEVQNLIEQMDQRVPGHGHQLAAELGSKTQAENKYPTATERKAARHGEMMEPEIASDQNQQEENRARQKEKHDNAVKRLMIDSAISKSQAEAIVARQEIREYFDYKGKIIGDILPLQRDPSNTKER
jgi:hypothetical protein